MEARRTAGIAYALLAYTSWGLLPAYWKALGAVAPLDLLMHRVVGTAVFVAFLLTASGRWREVRDALRRPRDLLALAGSAALIAVNWGIFIWAVQNEQIVASSLGYYLTPLVNVALGMLVLREELTRLQAIAVAIAAVGVAYFTASLGGLPWVSLALAGTFACYGLIRKTVGVASLAGLALETALLAPVALAGIAWREAQGEGVVSNAATLGPLVVAMLACAGPVTATPLIWFASAARRLRLATIGLFQYIAPSLGLALAVVFFGEPFTRAHAITFACIWCALALYSFESVRAFRAERSALETG
jgi:chloramphenicol-sensitive protein RarD